LVLFRLLGFKWAKQLDQYLVNLENKINAGFLGAWKNLNILASWINWITDPLGLWSSNVWFGALGQSITGIWAMIWGTQNQPIGAADAQYSADLRTWGTAQGQKSMIAAQSTGILTAQNSTYAQRLSAWWTANGYNPLTPP
jgi:hypothetical protein